MSSFAYYNGIFDKKENLRIPLSDRSIFFGDAVYDAAIGCYDRILWEDEHIDRLLNNANRIGIKNCYTKKFLSSLMREIGVKSGLNTYFIYCQISRSAKTRTHSANNSSTNLLITIDPIEIKAQNTNLKLLSVEDKRYDFCDIKSTNLLPAILAQTEAENYGFDEAVFLKNNIVTECVKSNISIINHGRVITHPKTSSILPGITREHLGKICTAINVPFIERQFNYEEMIEADEILVTSTTKLCKRVHKIDKHFVGQKDPELSEKICNLIYKDFVDFCKCH